MIGPQWIDDPDTPALQSNLDAVAQGVVLDAFERGAIDAELIKSWHVAMYDGISVPCVEYLGNFRGDSTHWQLLGAQNWVNGIRGTFPHLVYGEVERLLNRLNEDIALLDEDDSESVERDMKVLKIASVAHGEWVRIHPFVNGNGRTARFLVLWVLARFGIPPLLPVRPRPAPPYGSTANSSMTGEHEPFELYLRDLYATACRNEESAADEGKSE